MEELKFNIVSLAAVVTSMFLTQVETVLSITVLVSALLYNIVKIWQRLREK